MDLAAEQACDLTTDRKPKPGTAVAPTRRAVGLLERLEDQPQLVLGYADSRIGDGEPKDGLLVAERLLLEPRGLRRDGDAECDAAAFRELARVRDQVLQDLLEALLVRP